MTTVKQPLFLRIFKNGKLLDVKQFMVQQIVIGREGQVDALVNDSSVSPIHAMIEEREDGKYYLCDLGSQSGTFVNAEKIVDHQLTSGAEFQIGDIKIEFHVGVPRPKAAAAANSAPTPTAVAPTPTPAPTPSAPPTPAAAAAPVTPATKPTPVAAPKVIPEPVKEQPTKREKLSNKNEDKKTDVTPQPQPQPVVTPLVATSTLSSAGIGVVTPPSSPKRHSSPETLSGSLGQVSMTYGKPTPKTFAPASSVSMKKLMEPTKGTVVEVVLLWKDRVLSTYHYDKTQTISVGSHPKNQIILPTFGSVRLSHPLIRIDGSVTVTTTQDMTCEVTSESGKTSTPGSSYALQQGETMKVNIGEGVSLIIRYVESGPGTKLIPLIDMSANQLTALVLSLMGTALFLFYAYLYAPALPDKADDEPEPPRKAQFFYKAPPTTVEIEDKPVAHNAAENKKAPEKPAPSEGTEGASQEPKKTPNATNKVARAKGTSKNAAAAAAPKTPQVPKPKDVSKSGLLGAFSTKGTQEAINKASAAAGNVSGLSSAATGAASQQEGMNNGGDALKDIGANGNGTATVGIAGVKTKGRGGGVTGYGTGGLGAKKNASLIAGDDQATFSGTIDKEAIRRVVQANLKQIKACYERGLNKDPGLYGKIVIQWTIGGGGRVLEAAIKNTTMNSSEVENCAVSRLRTWKFPEPPAGEVAVVSYPFVFQAQE